MRKILLALLPLLFLCSCETGADHDVMMEEVAGVYEINHGYIDGIPIRQPHFSHVPLSTISKNGRQWNLELNMPYMWVDDMPVTKRIDLTMTWNPALRSYLFEILEKEDMELFGDRYKLYFDPSNMSLIFDGNCVGVWRKRK